MNEKTLHKQVCEYIRYQYPTAIFNSDLSGSMKLTIGQAVQIKYLRSSKGFPDIVIYEPKGEYHGLFLELKVEGTKLFKKDGINYISDHIDEQNKMIMQLSMRGYFADFVIGFDQAKARIDWYMRGIH